MRIRACWTVKIYLFKSDRYKIREYNEKSKS